MRVSVVVASHLDGTLSKIFDQRFEIDNRYFIDRVPDADFTVDHDERYHLQIITTAAKLQRSVVQLSFALVDAARLEDLFSRAGFHNIRVEKQTREGVIDSFEEYWEPIEAGTGSVPQIDLMLPEPERNAVRQEVKMRLAGYESGERLRMSVEMLIASLICAAKSYIRRSRGQV